FVTVADFNRDGIPDLAVTSLTDKKITIRLGTSDGTFDGSSFSRDVPATPQFIVAADFNGDGKLDVAAMLAGNFLSVFQGTGDGNINAGANLPVKGASFAAVAADFTGDGKPDILSANFQTGGFSLLTNLTAFVLGGAFGDPTDFAITADQNTSPAHAPEALAVGDFNRDGKLDLVTANAGSDNVSVFLGNGTGSFALTGESPFAAGTAPNGVATADFDRDGILDLAVANSGSDNNVSIFLGNGNGTFDPASTPTVTAGTTPAAVTIGDFNADGKLDLAVANNGSDNVSVLLGNGDGTFQSAMNSGVGTGPIALAVGDFDRDGVPDLAVVNSGGGVSILLGVGNGNFTQPVGSPFGVGTTPSAVAIGDFDSDGIPDLAVANSGSSNVSVLLGNGNGTFAAAVNFAVDSSPSSVAAADWDGDGKPDLAVGNAGGDNVSILFGDGAGGFSSALANAFGSPFAVGSTPTALIAGDFNRDGKLDLAAANGDGDSISILLNTAPPPVVIAPLAGAVWTIGSTQT
ncbi:MAG TPA: VCBS repeat-containing protein, partial [Thermomicrobiales bacterium]|nr:VCBS repeat-containing protein [Thermomicrobiales bacterium]